MFSNYLRSKSYYVCFHMYSLFLLMTLSVVIFVCHFVHPCEVSKGIAYLSAYASSFIHLSASFSLPFHLHWETWLWKYYIYYQIHHVLSAIEIHNLGENIADDFGLLLYLLCVSFSVPICIFETDGSQWCCVTYTCVYWDLEFQLLGELLKEGGEKKTQGGTYI